MAITVKCEQCGTLVSAPDSAAGKKGRCTVCGRIVSLPAVPDLEQLSVPVQPAVSEQSPGPDQSPGSELQPIPDIRIIDELPIAKPAPLPTTPPPIPGKAPSTERLTKSSDAKPMVLPPQEPKKNQSYCAIAALVSLAVMALTVTAVAIVLVFYVLPAFERAKDAAGLGVLKRVEMAELSHYQKNGEFAQRISGKLKSLESAGMVSPEDAAAEASPGPAIPVRGYLVRVLIRQGKSVPDGPKTYIDARGKMTSGFALLAYPANAASGKKSFLRGPDGTVYSKDFGTKTEVEAPAILSFDIDASWTPVAAPDLIGADDRAKGI